MEKYADAEDRMDALRSMDNVIFFSQKDNPPLPNRLSGGDLDGDRFEILTEDCGFWGPKYKTYKPDSYTDDGPKPAGKKDPENEIQSFDIKELANFIGNYIRNDCFLELQDTLMCLADQEQEGLKSARVRGLATWLSQAVDYPKSGEEVNLARDIFTNPDFNVTAKPDFLRALNRKAFHDANGEYYQSPNLLGEIYRDVADIKYKVPEVIDNSGLQKRLAGGWKVGPTESPSLANDLDGAVEEIVKEERARFLEYRNTQGLSEPSEIELFLRKQHDDFPNNLINDLVTKILVRLSAPDIIVFVDSGRRPPTVRPGKGYGHLDIEVIFRRCLYKAW
jgi:hypothetical protein